MNPISRVPIVQQVENAIAQKITTGEYAVGQKLPTEMDLCSQLGVGRGTVREAFRLLQAKGLVEIKPGRGAFVATAGDLSQEMVRDWFVHNEVELRDCMEVRIALEPIAVRNMIDRAGKAEVAKLERIHDRFLAAVDSHDPAAIAECDELFHSTIVEASQNKLLIRINKQTCEWIKAFRSRTFRVEQNVKNAVRPHTDIMNAIREGDRDAAERHMRRHLEQVLIDMAQLTGSGLKR